jgi:5-methylcytosine-specific restriction endonuclease McrA
MGATTTSDRRSFAVELERRHSRVPRGTCRWCGEDIFRPDGQPDRHRSWHPACWRAAELFNPGTLRARAIERDRGVCQACGLDAQAAERLVHLEEWGPPGGPWSALRRWSPLRAALREAGFDVRRDLLECDHVVPLWAGGPNGELANAWLLCQLCHKRKTRLEATFRVNPDLRPDLSEIDEARAFWKAYLGIRSTCPPLPTTS